MKIVPDVLAEVLLILSLIKIPEYYVTKYETHKGLSWNLNYRSFQVNKETLYLITWKSRSC